MRLTLKRDDADGGALVLLGKIESHQPVAVSHVAVPLLLPMSLGQTGGRWHADSAEGGFPIAFESLVLHDASKAVTMTFLTAKAEHSPSPGLRERSIGY